MGEWLSDTPIFQQTMTAQQKADAANFRRKVTTMPATIPNLFSADNNESNKKESTMTNKTATNKTAAKTTKKTATKKETNMENKTEKKRFTKEERKAFALKQRADLLNGLKDEHDNKPAIDEPVNICHIWDFEAGRIKKGQEKPTDLYLRPEEKELLSYLAYENGWKSNGFATANQFGVYGGTPKEGIEPTVVWNPRGTSNRYYNIDDIEFPEGGPAYNEDVAKSNAAKNREYNAKRRAAKFPVVTLDLPGGGKMTIHNKTELAKYNKLVAMMS